MFLILLVDDCKINFSNQFLLMSPKVTDANTIAKQLANNTNF